MKELGVQAGLTSVANEVVILVMVRGADPRRLVALGGRLIVMVGDDVDGSVSTVFRLAGRTSARQ
jgi:hypothetical protein